MELSGTYEISAPRTRVWQLMHNTAVMQECVPGCRELSDEGKGAFKAKFDLKFGPITANFGGKIFFSEQQEPESFTITGKHKGVPISVTKVRLTESNGITTIHYDVDTKIGGKFTWLTGSMINAVSKKLANEFFSNLAEVA